MATSHMRAWPAWDILLLCWGRGLEDARGPCGRWIIVWKDSNATDSSTTEAACLEAELVDAGRFTGRCSSRYSNVFHGFAAEVRGAQFRRACSALELFSLSDASMAGCLACRLSPSA